MTVWVLCFSLAYGFVQCSDHEYGDWAVCQMRGMYWQQVLQPQTSFRYECVQRIKV